MLSNNLEKQNIRWPYLATKLACTAAILLGSASLIGWLFYYWLSPDLQHELRHINPNTAVCFVMSGLALWILQEKNVRKIKYFSQVAAGTIFLLSVLTLFEYLFDINIGIDNTLFSDTVRNIDNIYAGGRMTPLVATNFAMIGFTLFFLDSRIIRYRVHQILLSIVIINTYFHTLINLYAIGTPNSLSGITNNYSQANMLVLIVFLTLSIGVLFSRPYKGIAALITSQESGGTLVRRVIPPALLLPILFGYFEILGENNGQYEHLLGITILIMGISIFFTSLILLNAYFVNKVELGRHQAEYALKYSQLQLKAILDHANSLISIYNLNDQLILINRQFEQELKLPSSEIIGKSIFELYDKETAYSLSQSHQKIRQTRAPLAVEEKLTTENRTQTYLSTKFPLFDNSGVINGICSISTDVTELYKMHDALKEREERLSLALKSAEAGTWNWDIIKNEIMWDEYLYKLFGLEQTTGITKFQAIFNFIHPDDRKRVQDEVQEVIKSGDDYNSEYRIILPSGEEKYFATRGHIFRSSSGKAIRMTGICWDITDRKHNEQELQKSKEQAEILAEQAKAANNAKSAFLAAMSHEIRTPLNGIIGMTEVAKNTSLTEEQKEMINTIYYSGKNLMEVINDILDFSKIESGQLQLNRNKICLHDLINEVVTIFNANAMSKGIMIDANIDSDVPENVICDSIKIKQILTNLISNAIKFTENGEVSISVTKNQCGQELCQHSDKINLLFKIQDTGIGIPSNICKTLFTPFSQGDISISRKYGGTGLGLVISKRFVELMKGSIGVESTPEIGSKFWFTLELDASESQQKQSQDKIAFLTKKHLLYIESNKLGQDSIKKATEKWGMICDTASNASDGITKLLRATHKNTHYDAIIISQNLPNMAGDEMIEVIRKLDSINMPPVLLLSSAKSVLYDQKKESLMIDEVIQKPVKISELFETLYSLLSNSTNESTQPTRAKPSKTTNQLQTVTNASILLVEDNIVNQTVVLQMLKNEGFEIDIAKNGIEALDMLRSNSYKLVLMDCQMPEMDGYTTTKKIRAMKDPLIRNIPIIAMTAHAFTSDKDDCLKAGMNDYISKPVHIDTLRDTIKKWLPDSNNNEEYKNIISNDFSSFNDRMKSIFGKDKVGIYHFTESLFASCDSIIDNITQELSNKNYVDLKALLHQLKGSTANCGFENLSLECAKAEELVMKQKFSDLETQFNHIKQRYSAVKETISKSVELN